MLNDMVVHIVDDDDAVRDSLALLLESAGATVHQYGSAEDLLGSLADLRSGCIVTDVRMPEIDGIQLMKRLAAAQVTLPVIVMTGHADVALAVTAMKAGAADFLEKPFDDQVLLDAIGAAIHRRAGPHVHDAERDAVNQRIETLSLRERQVLQGLVAGRANKVIAFDLGISPRTVEVYRANVMTKMQASSLSNLVRMALLTESA